jgi:hypothetical protein
MTRASYPSNITVRHGNPGLIRLIKTQRPELQIDYQMLCFKPDSASEGPNYECVLYLYPVLPENVVLPSEVTERSSPIQCRFGYVARNAHISGRCDREKQEKGKTR